MLQSLMNMFDSDGVGHLAAHFDVGFSHCQRLGP